MPDIVPLTDLVGVERLASHGKDYALRHRADGTLDVLRVGPAGAEHFGGGIDRASALRVVEGDASGRSAESARRFMDALDAVVDGVRPAVAEAARAAGYGPWHTGGGCMAWGRGLPDGTHILLTYGDEGLDGAPAAPGWIVGRYDAGDGFVATDKGVPLADAIRAAGELPVPIDANGETVDLTREDVASIRRVLQLRAEDHARTAARMGYEGLLKAASVYADGTLHEVALIGPGGPYGETWSVAVHQDCDPDEPTRGCSSIDSHPTPEAGAQAWRDAVAELSRLTWIGMTY